jgi:hypothetical protein
MAEVFTIDRMLRDGRNVYRIDLCQEVVDSLLDRIHVSDLMVQGKILTTKGKTGLLASHIDKQEIEIQLLEREVQERLLLPSEGLTMLFKNSLVLSGEITRAYNDESLVFYL